MRFGARLGVAAATAAAAFSLMTGVAVADQVQTIPATTIQRGARTFSFASSQAPWSNALISIDRTISGGLNSLPATATLTLDIQYSLDGGATWNDLCGSTLQGGTITVKGVTLTTDTLECGIGVTFPTGTLFELNTNASARVVVDGQVTYTNT